MDKDATMVEINPFAEDAQGGKQSLPFKNWRRWAGWANWLTRDEENQS